MHRPFFVENGLKTIGSVHSSKCAGHISVKLSSAPVGLLNNLNINILAMMKRTVKI